MKRIINLILALATLLSLLAGCKGEGDLPTVTEPETEPPLGRPVDVYWFTENGDFLTAGNVGRTPTPPAVEQTITTAKFVYTFTGWDKELAPIREEDVQNDSVYYRAVYEKTKRMYNVNFVADGQILQTIQCGYGDSIPSPTVEAPAKSGYAYAFWAIDPAAQVKSDVTVNADYANRIGYTLNSTPTIKDGVYYMPILSQKHSDGRATPVALNPSTGYDSLIFYEREADGVLPDPNKTVEEILSDMQISYKMILDQDFLLDNAYISNSQYAPSSIVQVNDSKVPFEEAKKVSINTKTEADYAISAKMSLDNSTFKEGDVLMLSCWIRFVSAKVESNCGQIRLVCEHPTTYSKNLNFTVSKAANGEWFRVILTFTAKEGFSSIGIAMGSCVQELEIAGFEIRNCGNQVSADEIPRDSLASLSNGLDDLFNEDVQWRKDAWERIEAIRKGDLTVTVVDANGQVIPNAEVQIQMTEHDFKFGTCIAEILMNNQNYNNGLSLFFNSAVSGTGTKWACYEKEPQRALTGHRIASDLGINYFRGHTLVWDYPISKTTDEDGNYKFDDNIPERLWSAIVRKNKEQIYQYYEEWIKHAAETFSYVGEWDVLNEPNANHYLIERYGYEIVKNWFEWARKYSPEGTKLYVNETAITNANTAANVAKICAILDKMVENNVPFDGIGIQGHTDEFASPMEFYNNLMALTKYGKEMKVTEFDTGRMMQKYPYAEAAYVRDVMILIFSMEEMTGFFMWGFWDNMSTWGNAPLFDANWNLKPSGEQYLDLVYNQWWTREAGKTGTDGTLSTRAFFGTYDITVTANGKTVTQTVSMPKDSTGSFTVVVK